MLTVQPIHETCSEGGAQSGKPCASICMDHWHCDQLLSAHACAVHRQQQPCPSCGAEAQFNISVIDQAGQPARIYPASGSTLTAATIEAFDLCSAGGVGREISVLATAFPPKHPMARVARMLRTADGVDELEP